MVGGGPPKVGNFEKILCATRAENAWANVSIVIWVKPEALVHFTELRIKPSLWNSIPHLYKMPGDKWQWGKKVGVGRKEGKGETKRAKSLLRGEKQDWFSLNDIFATMSQKWKLCSFFPPAKYYHLEKCSVYILDHRGVGQLLNSSSRN